MTHHHPVSSVRQNTTHEDREVNVMAVVLSLTGLIVMTIFCAAIVFFMFVGIKKMVGKQEHPISQVLLVDQTPPEPRLQQDPKTDLKKMRAKEDALLTSYGWVDASTGAVRIPVAEAMKMIAKKGLPVSGTSTQAPASKK